MIDALKIGRIENIKTQLELIYSGDPWYGNSIKSVMSSVNPELIFDSPESNMHSIAEIVAHMLAYRNFTEDRLKGSMKGPPKQEETFDWRRFTPDKTIVWEIMINRLDSSHENLLTLLNQHGDSILDQKVTGKSYSFGYLLTGILQHDLYHLGQIVYVNKLLGKSSARRDRLTYDSKIFSYESMIHVK